MLFTIFAILSLLATRIYCLAQPLLNDAPQSIYALLVAGSNGISNYRHQADVAHAYHLLIEKGVPAENIVTMMYDDVAYDPKNPHPGELRNIQNGPDYRKGMKVDYRTTAVNKYVFEAVLTGNSARAALYGGSGRVLKSTSADNVFIFYSDHGAYNILGMPSGPPITKSDLQNYINAARNAGKFHKLSMYVEACESGSILEGFEKDDRVNGLTASSATEDSYACNCAGAICYADLFSYKWMTNSEQHNLMGFSVQEQYSDVKKEVHSSTVQIFGSTAVTNEPVGYFQGTKPSRNVLAVMVNSSSENKVVSIRDVPIHMLVMSAEGVQEDKRVSDAVQQLELAFKKRELFRNVFDTLHQLIRESINEHQGDFELNKELRDHCYETLVLQFDEHCFPLRNNAFAFGSLRRFRSLCVKTNSNVIQRAIDTMRLYCRRNSLVVDVQGVE
ncbi:unnamed protein product [Cylicocyclus nassatus]|uniref:Legumain n=1 Tax=Cylicocyclus nassatus TaxID=53992 RepID=A0AA36GEM8_CYLNA|nr:unnamed protein product [Cylicocyclus nassatus]